MTRRITKKVQYVRLRERRIREIEDLVASWPNETKAFMRSRLNQYRPPSDFLNTLIEKGLSLFLPAHEKRFNTLKDPDILTDWQKRFEISGQTNPQEAWNKILEKEVSAKDYIYLLSLLDNELVDVHVPYELVSIFEKVYRAHIKKEYMSDPTVPKAPLMLVVGASGSGKSVTVNQAIENVIFENKVLPEIDLKQKKEELLSEEPFWKSIEEIDPTLSEQIAKQKRIRFYKAFSKIPIIRRFFKKRISRNLFELDQEGMSIDYSMVTPNDYQTALAGEPGNYFKKSLGDPRKPAIRHVEEAHSAFGKIEGQSGIESQQRTLIDTGNIVIDEIISGKRDCLLIATTDQPQRFDAAIYRRFTEKGIIIDLSKYWENADNLREIIRLELLRCDVRIGSFDAARCHKNVRCIPDEELDAAVDKIYTIFQDRTLKLSPSYVRKLIHSVIEIKGDFSSAYLDDAILVRKAFELVAKNSYGDLYNKFVDRMDRRVKWEEYVGDVKDGFSEMANNCLYYHVSEEKGVVLKGPPGSGKTFLVRSWLSENSDVHDISTSPGALQDPVNPVDGAVENLEKVYDIAKMIAPATVFFDEGDSLAPKRSASGGSPSDKLTNKFLNLIDGEIPLNRVFTVLTTNRLDILDPALIRSKRLKVLEISGHLRGKDIQAIMSQALKNVPLSNGLDINTVIESARGISNTPADYAAFVEKARSLRTTEHEVLLRFRSLTTESDDLKKTFIKFNFKTLLGILEAIGAPQNMLAKIKGTPRYLMEKFDEIAALMDDFEKLEKYPLMPSHLHLTRQSISQSPVKKGKVQLDEFLEAELSQEPQIGFVIGVGANDVAGVLLPIATSLTYRLSPEKVLVTGAVSSSSPAAAEMEMAVQMTQQSAQEAFTLVKNYLQSLDPKVSIARLFGEFLDKYTIHHQLLSASYNVGGPSAGYALAINTLSAILHIPVYHDFGITGAPWTKGVKKGEVGGSVIIGGHKKKTETVLTYLRRMYMPLKNYQDLELDYLVNYWAADKDILGVTHFGELVPEVVCLDQAYEKNLKDLTALRIAYKMGKYQDKNPETGIKEEILLKKEALKGQVESVILARMAAVRNYLRDPVSDPHLSLDEIYRDTDKQAHLTVDSLIKLIKGEKKINPMEPLRRLFRRGT